ncbi:MAG: hypothetical protein J1E64_06675 [Acetatifactor sp.]|nr:hypothetical protein [Acetatifactor sp.]
MPEEKIDRVDIIVKLCFGPLETEIWGVKDGRFFRENQYIEGIREGDIDFDYIGEIEFLQELDREIKLSMDHNCIELIDMLNKYRARYFG